MIQFISHFTDQYSYLDSIRLALTGGCRWIQLRVKDVNDDELLPLAIEAQKLCREAGATFIIDDHVELVKQIKADGVHLGLHDMPISEAREILGPGFIIGGTANTFQDVLMHYQAGANYIGCGPFRYTSTKKNLSPILGLDGYREITRQMHSHDINLPIVAIGGITVDDIPAIMQTGVSGIALSGTILRSTDPVAEMHKIIDILSSNINK